MVLQAHKDHLDARLLVVILALVAHLDHRVCLDRLEKRVKRETTERTVFQAGRVAMDNLVILAVMVLTAMPVTADPLVHAAFKASQEKQVR